ncbi:MAG: hypothetical protein J6T13_01650 [Bacteroidales bacterium]|nr:hypothetical protein [Bacteroidales bacterium]
MSLIILGYIFGIIHKLTHNYDIVMWLYVLNGTMVFIDLMLYFYYSRHPKVQDGIIP